jgi:PilZ domain
MAAQMPRIRLWRFREAPVRFQELFPEGKDPDWIASVPEPLADLSETQFLRWRKLYPVSSMRLPDGTAVHWGAPRESVNLIADRYAQPASAPTDLRERRAGVRIPLGCSARYQAGPSSMQTGIGHIIDMSSSGAAFTTGSLLPPGSIAALYIPWPISLDDGVPVELHAVGKVVRGDETRAALQFDRVAFVSAP